MDNQTETNTRPTNPADILDCAADLIAERGLARGKYYDASNGTYCALGAIHQCASGSPWSYTTPQVQVVKNLLYPRVGSITSWNDNPRRPKSTIVRTLRRVAARYRAAHPEEA